MASTSRAARTKTAEPSLNLAPGLTLPLQAVTETFAIIAKKRAGKSNSAVVMAEVQRPRGAHAGKYAVLEHGVVVVFSRGR